jgi:hypothetical protein
MATRYTFVAKGLDIDDDDIDDKINDAAEAYAKKKHIEHYLITDYFNDEKGVRINLEDIGE